MTLARKISWGCCVVVFLVLGVSAMAQSSASGAALGQPPLGIPAITPRGLQQTGATFTAADVMQWGNSHQIGMQPQGAAHPQIVSVEFITAAQASQRMGGESIGVPDSSLVCYVQAHGDFIETGPPALDGRSGYAVLHDHDYTLVLDAQTGNILVEG